MPTFSHDTESGDNILAWLLRLLDQAYNRKSWHGPNLKGSIRGVEAPLACWRPAPARHSIAEHVLHAAYWKYTVRRRLNAERRGSFARKGSNWFFVSDLLESATWREITGLLEAEHRALRAAVEAFELAQLHNTPPGSQTTWLELIQGIAFHDVYHAGQIQGLKRLHLLQNKQEEDG